VNAQNKLESRNFGFFSRLGWLNFCSFRRYVMLKSIPLAPKTAICSDTKSIMEHYRRNSAQQERRRFSTNLDGDVSMCTRIRSSLVCFEILSEEES